MMSWLNTAWDWYAAHPDKVNPIIAGLGGAALVWAAVRQARTATNRHYEQTRADQQRRLTESFSKAVEQLASDKIEARLGGIYTLERLAIEAIAQVRSSPWWRRLWWKVAARREIPSIEVVFTRFLERRNLPSVHPQADPVSDLYWTVMETLTAFVRERTRWQEPQAPTAGMAGKSNYLWGDDTRSDAAQPQPPPATDIAAVLAVICRRPDAGQDREKQRRWHLDLRTTDLRGTYLFMSHLEGADLRRAHLEYAYLYGAHLEYAYLNGAHLEGADLRQAHLYWAHLEGADLFEAHLEGADLREATGDAKTRLPDGVARPTGWPAYKPD